MYSASIANTWFCEFLSEFELYALLQNYSTGSSKKRELSLVGEVPSGLFGYASAALSYWVGGRREIQTVDFSFARACKQC